MHAHHVSRVAAIDVVRERAVPPSARVLEHDELRSKAFRAQEASSGPSNGILSDGNRLGEKSTAAYWEGE